MTRAETLSPAQEIVQATARLREAPERPVDAPLARWLESWTGIDFHESGALPDDLQHALAIARSINAEAMSVQLELVTISGQRYEVVEWDSRGDQGHGYEEFVLYATPVEEGKA